MSFIAPVVVNDSPQSLALTVADLEVGDCFLWDGGKVYQKTSADTTLCQINGVVNSPADFGAEVVAAYRLTQLHIVAKIA